MSKKFKIRTINKDGDHGMWKDMVAVDFTQQWGPCSGVLDDGLQQQAQSKVGLHTDWLIANGWARNGRIYTKGNDVIKYDGTYWILNGEQL